ncbi:MAG: methyltransferase domain-containing protein [Spirochaetaceae bacterium]|nr:methyltransferase domain-containing protein [Spirochaetaceae bacterium]HPG28687.1 methyltransferase domain-containing protein [Myxococcota bacterium]
MAYQERRRGFLSAHVALDRATGIEFGAFDLPTVPAALGRCTIADIRSEVELARRFGHPIEDICPVDYVYDPARPVAQQIDGRFDYAILCHVIEHVPDVIRALCELRELLVEGGILFLAVPDKRETPDVGRPSTTLSRLIERARQQATGPSFSEVAEFALAWRSDARTLYDDSVRRFYDAVAYELAHGTPDVHCNVWRDEELFDQLRELIRGGYLADLEIVGTHPTQSPFNEFYVALMRVGERGTFDPARGAAGDG